MAMAHDIGARVDDALEGAEALEMRLSGAPDWVRRAAQSVLGLHADVDKEVDEAKIDLLQAKVLKDLITKAAGRVQVVLVQVEAEQRIAAGRVAGLRVAIDITRRVHAEEANKVAKAEADEALAKDAGVEPGGRKPPLKARRQKAAKRAKNTG